MGDLQEGKHGPRGGHAEPCAAHWNNIPSPYLADRFNAFTDRGNLTSEAWVSTRT